MIWLEALSDLFINLSAGWFGAAFVIPLVKKEGKINWILLTGNVLSGILSFILGVALKGGI